MSSEESTPAIRIMIHHEPITVTYTTVLEEVPKIYDASTFDYIIHVGVGLPGPYCLESVAHAAGYDTMHSVSEKAPVREVDGLRGFPSADGKDPEIHTSIDVHDVVLRVKRTKVRIHCYGRPWTDNETLP